MLIWHWLIQLHFIGVWLFACWAATKGYKFVMRKLDKFGLWINNHLFVTLILTSLFWELICLVALIRMIANKILLKIAKRKLFSLLDSNQDEVICGGQLVEVFREKKTIEIEDAPVAIHHDQIIKRCVKCGAIYPPDWAEVLKSKLISSDFPAVCNSIIK